MSYTGDRSKVVGPRSRRTAIVRPSTYHLPPTTYHLLRCGFTLMEMMAVITIVSLMLLVAMPAMNKIGGAKQVTNAARQFSNAMAAARQFAITRNMRTRVVIAFGSTVIGSDPATLQYMRYSAYAVMGQPSSTTDFAATAAPTWRYVQAWQFLPKGIIFDPISSPNPIQADDGVQTQLENSTLFDGTRSLARVNVPFPDDSSTTLRQVVCIEFRPTGQPVSVTSSSVATRNNTKPPTSVRLINGTVEGRGGSTSNITVPGRTSPTVLRSGSNPTDPAKVNCVVLSWDEITGRVSWVQPGS